MGRRKGKKPEPAPQVIDRIVEVAPKFQPINFTEIVDYAAGEHVTFHRDGDKQMISIKDLHGREPIDRPITLKSFDGSLPAVANIAAPFAMRYATAAQELARTFRDLLGEIAITERTNPTLLEQNREFLDSIKQAQQYAIDKNFDVAEDSLESRLKRLGINKSSTGLELAARLTKQRVESQLEANTRYIQLAQELKQDTLKGMHARGSALLEGANTEIARYQAETATELEARGQDLNTQIATESIRQDNAYRAKQLELEARAQDLTAQLEPRKLRLGEIAARNYPALAGDQLATGNTHALTAAATDNSANMSLGNLRQNQYRLQMARQELAAEMKRRPLAELALNTGAALLTGKAYSAWGLGPKDTKKLKPS